MVRRNTRRTQPVRRRKLQRNRRPTQVPPSIPKESNWEKFLKRRRATRTQRDNSRTFFTFKRPLPTKEDEVDKIIQQGLPTPMEIEETPHEELYVDEEKEESPCMTSSDDEILENWDFGDDYGPVGSPPQK